MCRSFEDRAGIALRVRDVLLERNTAVHLHGKGKQRAIPLWKNTGGRSIGRG